MNDDELNLNEFLQHYLNIFKIYNAVTTNVKTLCSSLVKIVIWMITSFSKWNTILIPTFPTMPVVIS